MERKSKIDIDEAIRPKTEAAIRMGDQTAFPTADKQVPLANGAASVEEVLPPGYDKFYLTDEEKRGYGIDPATEEHVWIRTTAYWKGVDGNDRGRQFKRENIGGRVILQDGEPVMMEDLTLAARSKEAAQVVEERNAAAMREYEAAMDERNQDFDTKDRERLENIRAETQETAYRLGWYGEGSPTHRKTLEQVYSEYTKAEILAEEERCRAHGRRRADDMSAAEQQTREERTAARGGKTFGGFGKAAFLQGPKGAK